MRRILLTTALLLLSVACLCATEAIGTMQLDYVLNKVSVGEVSQVFFASPSAPNVPLASFAINMYPDNTEDFTAYSTPQLLLVQENNLSSTDYARRISLTFTTFVSSDGNNLDFSGDYAVAIWRFQNPQNSDLAQLASSRDKGSISVKKSKTLSWELDNAGTTDGSYRFMYYALSFVFSGKAYISNVNKAETLTHMETYPPGSYHATISIELQGN